MRNQCVDLDFEYALRMISAGSATPEQAARMCGIPLATLQARMRESASVPSSQATVLAATADTGESRTATRAVRQKPAAGKARRETDSPGHEPTPLHVAPLLPAARVYSRTAKGVLAITAQTKRLPSTLKNVFFAVDNKATVGELLVTLDMNPAYIHHALRTLENDGYIAPLREESAAHERANADCAEDTDLDFTAPDALSQPAPATRRANPVREIAMRADAVTESAHASSINKLTGLAPRTGAPARQSPEREATQPLLRPVSINIKAPAQLQAVGRAQIPQAPVSAVPEKELAAERRIRETAQANAETDRRAREEAMQLLEEAVQALHDMKTSTAEQQRSRTKADAAALAERKALQARLDEAEAALDKAEKTSLQAQLQIGKERRSREDAEAQARDERRGRTEALQTLELAKQQAEDSDARRVAAEARLGDLQRLLERTEVAGSEERDRLARLDEQIAAERRAREQAEGALETERRAHHAAAKSLIELKQAMSAQGEEHAHALAEAHSLRNALHIELTDAKTERERAIEAAYRHAERHAQIEMEVESQRRARQDAEAKARAEQDSREAAAQALLEVKRAIGLWKNS